MSYPKLQLKTDFKKRLELSEAPKKERNKKTTEKVKAQAETIEEAWVRILAMKNSEADSERLLRVKHAMQEGLIGRDPSSASKRFSKAEALRLFKDIEESERADKLEEMVKKTPSNYILVENDETFKLLLSEMDRNDLLAIDCETYETNENESALDPWSGHMAGFTVSSRNYHFYVPTQHTEETELVKERGESFIMKSVKERLEKPEKKLILHNAPFDAKWFYVYHGIDFIDNIYADTRILAFLMDENRSHALKDLATDWLKMPSDKFNSLFKEGEFNKVPLRFALAYGAKDGDLCFRVFDFCEEWLNKRPDLQEIRKLAYEVEMPVLRQMIRSDLRGIGFDKEEAKRLDKEFEEQERQLDYEIRQLLNVDDSFNIGSPVQLSRKLFVDLRLKDLNKGSTSSKVLKKLVHEHPVVSKILEHREVSKLRNSFTVKLPKAIKEDGRIHPWHNSLGAKTGRFTAKSPNLQQVPSKRSEVRKLFVPGKGKIFISYDLSQIELRVVAILAQEDVMLGAFSKGFDLHSTTAAQISGIPYEQVQERKDIDKSPEQKWRKIAKILNFALLYGVSAKGLADMLGCSVAEAEIYIENFFKGYPKISAYMDKLKADVQRTGFVSDMWGRKRRFHKEIKEGDKFKLYGVLRQCCNYPVQASAGTYLKIAMTNISQLLPKLKADVQILLQIHDELVFEADEDISYEEVKMIQYEMENAVKFEIPIKSDAEISPNRWMEGTVSPEVFFEVS